MNDITWLCRGHSGGNVQNALMEHGPVDARWTMQVYVGTTPKLLLTGDSSGR
jgi:hypothetical protein